MITQILYPDQNTFRLAADYLASGEVVSFPTETVYGLGAYALNPEAVSRIFEVKGRPADNPLIVHIFQREQLSGICEVPDKAIPLMDAFWPGPLTILFPRKPSIPDIVTAGLSTVAVRNPSHPTAAELLRVSGLPVAAPSANLSGRPSPTSATHVFEDFSGRIPLIIDGGTCQVGLESTVLDISGKEPCILRPGGITKEMIEEVLGQPVSLAGSILRPLKEDEKALSPGMRYRHYAPKAVLTLVRGSESAVIDTMRSLCSKDLNIGRKSCILCFTEHVPVLSGYPVFDLGSKDHPEQTAQRLFDMLRNLDRLGMETAYCEVLPPKGVGLAVMNRLGRAASFHIIEA